MGEQAKRGGLSVMESRLLSSFSEQGETVVSLKDIETKLECAHANAKVIANRLVRKAWLTPIGRGVYLIAPLAAGVSGKWTAHAYVLASRITSPYYIGYWNALNFHNMTEYLPVDVTVVTTKRLKKRTVLGVKITFIALGKQKFFGYSKYPIAGENANISNPEKTIIDCLDHPEYCGGISEVSKAVKNSWHKLSHAKLAAYAKRIGNSAVAKRLGYLIEALELTSSPAFIEKIRALVRKGYSPLDPVGIRNGEYNAKWNLLVNLDERSLGMRDE